MKNEANIKSATGLKLIETIKKALKISLSQSLKKDRSIFKMLDWSIFQKIAKIDWSFQAQPEDIWE